MLPRQQVISLFHLSLVTSPDPSEKWKRGPGALSNTSRHMGHGLLHREWHNCILHPGIELSAGLDCCCMVVKRPQSILEQPRTSCMASLPVCCHNAQTLLQVQKEGLVFRLTFCHMGWGHSPVWELKPNCRMEDVIVFWTDLPRGGWRW